MNRDYVTSLPTDDDTRARLVSTMRQSADRLLQRGLCAQLTPAERLPGDYQLAQELLDAAAQLCDHIRVCGDGRCRYCDAVVVEVR
jgi:hypothetical protein